MDEGDLIDEGLPVGGFDTGQVRLIESTGVETMFEGVKVAPSRIR